jgi:large subunit ribosomal protein L5e
MGFIKVVKNKAYFKRFQVKFKRRRQAKTDYYARKRLIIQDKNKYKTPKYRFVVRFSNRDITCQIFSADMTHDVCFLAAYAHELPRFGVKVGLNNYAAAYCTGLLLARRVNKKLGLEYNGQLKVDGAEYHVDADAEGKAPFKALLDVGLRRTTTGAKLFGALKGACDGGLDIPHNDRRFPGTKKEGDDFKADPETHKKYIFGGHVAGYMKTLAEDDEEAYKRQFGRYIAAGVAADAIEGMYKGAHAAIRKDPNLPRGPKERGSFCVREKERPKEFPKKKWQQSKLSKKQRAGRIRQKITNLLKLAGK